ncbi:MAG: hypothetical protein ACLP9C_09060 [Acidimicrobiales bacterium]
MTEVPGVTDAPEFPTVPDDPELGTVAGALEWCEGVSLAATPTSTTTAALAPAAIQVVIRRTLVAARSRAP